MFHQARLFARYMVSDVLFELSCIELFFLRDQLMAQVAELRNKVEMLESR